MSSHRSVRSVIAAAGLAALTETAYAQTLSTAFTYQGRLTEAGNPGNGPYDFKFKLFDAS